MNGLSLVGDDVVRGGGGWENMSKEGVESGFVSSSEEAFL